MADNIEQTLLERRFRQYIQRSDIDDPMDSLDDLRSGLNKHRDELIGRVQNKGVLKYASRWVVWDKFRDMYGKAVDIIVEDNGEGILKEWQVAKKAKDLPDDEFRKKLPEIVAEVYGSLDDYACYGRALQSSSGKLRELIVETELNLIERAIITHVCQGILRGIDDTGDYIISAAEQTQALTAKE